MSRMDKYIDEEQENNPSQEVVLSRVNKNQIMYDDVYFNRTMVDINSVIDGEDIKENKQEEIIPEEVYEKKSYSVNEYLEKAHENKSPDNLKRDIDDTAFKEQEDEIRRLIDSINEKEEEEDLFKDLKGDDEDTLVDAKLKTDDFNDSIYENLKNENLIEEDSVLDHVLSDKTVVDLEREEESTIDHTFEKIMLEDNKAEKKGNKLPIIIFCIVLVILVIVIALILILKKG